MIARANDNFTDEMKVGYLILPLITNLRGWNSVSIYIYIYIYLPAEVSIEKHLCLPPLSFNLSIYLSIYLTTC